MHRLFCVIFVLLVVGLGSYAGASESKSPEMLYYRWTGGLAQYSPKELTITADGSGSVTLGTREGSKSVAIRINESELAGFRQLVETTNFFSLTESVGSALDAGKTTLRISLGGKTREFNYVWWPEMRPLEEFCEAVIDQAAIIINLEADRPANALSALSPFGGDGKKVILRDALKDAYTKYLRTTTNPSGLFESVEALTYILMPNDYADFMLATISSSDKEHRALLLHWISGCIDRWRFSGLSAYSTAMRPVLGKIIREDYHNYKSLPTDYQRAIDDFIDYLGPDAVPAMIESNPDLYQENGHMKTPMIKNSGEGLKNAFPFLWSDNTGARACAAWLFGDIFGWPPGYVLHCEDATQADKDAVLKFCRETVVPMLKDIAKSDPDERVRQAAKLSIEQIGKGWHGKDALLVPPGHYVDADGTIKKLEPKSPQLN